MFTGIVEKAARVADIQFGKKSIRLVIHAGSSFRKARLGESIAVNGCCLTVVGTSWRGKSGWLSFDLLEETWNRTNLKHLKPDALVNLERALRADALLGGHFVSGHIDGTGRITRWEHTGKDHVLEIEAPPDMHRYLVFKGSIAVDGISLTVAAVTKKGFRIWIIPHTYEITALRDRSVGDEVNLEADLLAKYVERILAARESKAGRSKAAGKTQRNSKGPRK